MTKKMSKKKIEQRKIIILKCLIVLMTINSIFLLYNAYHCEIANMNNKTFWEKKATISLIINCVIIALYFWIGHSIKNLKKKLK